jgi:hypothetical protein
MLKVAVVACVLAAAPLLAQQPRDSSEAILRAARTESSQKLAAYRVVADTAWATVVDLRDYGLVDPRKGIAGQEIRLERRGTAWSRVSTRSVVVTPPSRDTAAAKPFKLAPPPPRP